MKKTFSRSLSCLLSMAMLFGMFIMCDWCSLEVNALNAKKDGYSRNYTLGDDPGQNVANVAYAQIGKTYYDFNYGNHWCSYFAHDCFELAGQGTAIPNQPYVPDLPEDLRKAGINKINISEVRPGDIVLFDANYTGDPEHIEIVYKVVNGVVYSIGGNTGGSPDSFTDSKVSDARHNPGNVYGYYRPNYTGHIHSYTEYVYYWKDHPHYKCYRCSCGDIKENRNEPTYVDTCAECNKQNNNPYPEPTRNLSLQSPYCTGDDVKWVQWYLVQLGYSLDIDGIYGKDTHTQVANFQRDNGLTVDGICGAGTRSKLKEKGPHTHNYSVSARTEPTCTQNGSVTYKCSCDASYSETLNALGHSYTTKTVAATCTAQGYTLHTCSRCGNSYKDTYTNALGHNYTTKVVAPTYTEQGYTLHTCSRCGNNYKDSYTNKLQYVISYNMNGGSGSIANQLKNHGQDITLSSTKPTRTGYDFLGWNTNSGATTATYQPSQNYSANANLPLYAIWKAKQVTVTFYRNIDGNDTTTSTQTFTYGVSGQSFSNKNWSRDGYTLLGWSENRSAADKQYSTNSGVDPNWIIQKSPKVNLYAVWKASGKEMSESEAAGRTIPDGDYYIVNEINQDYFVDIPGNDFNTTSGTNVQMWIWSWESSMPPKEGYDCFHFEYLNNGFYKISQINTNMCIDVAGASIYKGTNVQMCQDNGYTAQQWSVERTSHGYRIRSRCNGYFLDVVNGNHESGTNLRCWDGNDSKAQSFSFIPRDLNEQPITDDVYTIKTNVNQEYILDVSGNPGQFHSGSNVQIWTSVNNTIIENYIVKYVGNGWYKIFEKTSGLIVEFANPDTTFLNNWDKPRNVQLAEDNGGKNQLWKIRKNSDGTYFIINKANGYYLDLENSKTENGANVSECTYNGSNAQRWIIKPVIYTISYNMNSGTGSIASQTKTYGQDLTLSWYIPTRTDYKFIGWNTDKNATTAQYKAGSNYTANSSAVLYAIWEKIDYNATPAAKGNFNGNTYEYYTQTLNWNQAYRFCEKKGGHLVTVTSKEENDFIVELTKSRSGNLWAGGKTSDHKTWYWITGETFNYQNWDVGEPNNLDNAQDTLHIYVSGKWDDVGSALSTVREFVCEYDKNIDAAKYIPAYTEQYNDHEYYFFADSVDWQTARKICEAKGGYLAIPNNAEENAFIISGMKKTSKEESWIGITDIAQEGVWKDVKGNSLTYTNWASGQPDNSQDIEDYGHLYSDGQWNDGRGYGSMYRSIGFVCEFDTLCTASGHDYKLTSTKAATCTANGEKIYTCSRCGHTKTETIKATGHKYTEKVVAPTTAAQGYTLHTCSVCGHSYKDNYTDKLLEQLVNNSTLSAETIKLGETVTVSAKASGGAGSYQYNVLYKQKSQSKWTTVQAYKANATVSIKPANATTYDICVKVKDSNGTEVKKYFTVKVTTALQNNSIISKTEINLGDTITVNGQATGGTGSYTYAVYYKKTSDSKWLTAQAYKNNATVSIKPADATTYDICVKVKDSDGTEVKKYVTVKVTNALQNNSTISKTEINLGDTVTVNGKATGGTGNYTYAVYYKETSDSKWTTAQSYKNNAAVSIKFDSVAEYNVCIKVKDSSGTEVKTYITVKVLKPVSTLNNTSTISAAKIKSGESVTISGSATGGTSFYQYAFYYKKSADTKWTTKQSYNSNFRVSIQFDKAATYDICVKVKDSDGNESKKYFTVTVTDSKLVNTSVLSTDSIKLNENVYVFASAKGTTDFYQYAVYIKPENSTSWQTVQSYGSNAVVQLKPTKTGTYDVCVKAKDNLGEETKIYLKLSVK